MTSIPLQMFLTIAVSLLILPERLMMTVLAQVATSFAVGTRIS